MNEHTINASDEINILGITLDKNTNMIKYCRDRATIAHSRVALLTKISCQGWGANRDVLLRLYKQFVRPVLEYGYTCTHNALPTAIKQLQLAERRALRVVLNAKSDTRIDTLYGNTNLERIEERLVTLSQKAEERHIRFECNKTQREYCSTLC